MATTPINDILSWAKENGALISDEIDFKIIESGNIGAFTKQTSENDKLSEKLSTLLDESQIKLPKSLIITLQTAINSFGPEFTSISSKTLNINSVLKLYLAREVTNTESFFKPYLSLLPTLSQVNSPYTWTADQKLLLKDTNLGNSLNQNLFQIIEEWWQVINLLPESIKKPEAHFMNMKFYYEYKFYKDEDFYKYFITDFNIDNWTNFANYLWSSIILKSRSFPAYLLKDDSSTSIKKDEAMLLPLIDLLNHNPKSNVSWLVDEKYFSFKSDSASPDSELFNNYGMKGNEELLLGYGFCIENNSADSAALKLQIPQSFIDKIIDFGIELPTMETYTTSVIRTDDDVPKKATNYEDGILFFITENNLPENLIQVFQYVVRNEWENGLSTRMQLHGLNQLRQAIELKLALLKVPKVTDTVTRNIKIYIESQQRIFKSTIKRIKLLEKDLLAKNKLKLISLKTVYKNDIKSSQSLLLTFGFTSYDQILDHQFQDQYWLLYLIRCYNRQEYIPDTADEGDENNYLPKWIQTYFNKVVASSNKIIPEEVVQYKEIYQNLIPPLNKAVPEIFGKGKWGVEELIYSARLLDKIGFVRGKDQECILVIPDDVNST